MRIAAPCRLAEPASHGQQPRLHMRLYTSKGPWARPLSGLKAGCRHLTHRRPSGSVVRHAGAPGPADLPPPEEWPLPPAKGPLLFNTFPSLSSLESISGSVDEAPLGQPAQPNQDGQIPSGPPSRPPQGGMAHRWKITWAMAIAFILCNLDKVNMSVAIIPMAEELGWKASDRGIASAAFFWGYTLTQIPAGIFSTRLGGAKVLLVGVALWSFGTLLAPSAAHLSLGALCATRAFVGLGEGLAPSSATNVMARMIPERERSTAVTTVFGALDVGSAMGLLACPPLIRMFGWPSVFTIFAIVGLVWCSIWPTLKPEQPDEDAPPPPPPQAGKLKVPWGIFLRSRPVWAIICAHFCFNWGYYTLLAWLPSFFQLALHLSVETSSLLTLVPYIAMSSMTPFVGKVADGLVAKGWEMTDVRKLAQGVAFAGPAACMITCGLLTPAAVSSQLTTGTLVVLLSIAFACGSWARAGLYCNHQDLSPKYAGALLGLSNTFGAVPGALGATSVGFLLDYFHDWGIALFYPTAAFQLFGLTIYTLYASSKRQEWA